MPLVKDGRIVEDVWRRASETEDLEAPGPIFATLELWQEARQRLLERNTPLGIWLRSDQFPDLIADSLDRFAAIALEFPKFTDGRAYSSARILRERYGYKGELRAVGNVLRDQLLFMHRCGFDAFDLGEGSNPEELGAALAEFSFWYQPAADTASPIAALRKRIPVES